ncbi:DUF3613 domain-containing protein [Comamonas thiooxydans]|uniref:DUF3613 domain-containing protein n=1 Tax=Comamonas thiooxydans TaxID=363952 RepID=A0A0E3C6S3_9BURK|nr:DUF3613 domain-containing protein [Comamonas thiooxydans]KGG90357.1 hypothetical protein P609_02005 [Comamonas thiooxydans]KGH14085.1 hypothetical protein P607_23560 [Comamonas thiooxydans]KGH16938.1 hypothetical protein P606_26885 [Comamonas thiooxydans]KGH21526.1 hypothetical protein P608_02045 [Comamonas thiooxydans]OAD83409.1 hypothetical protein ATN89_13080 [Comamonas thiooxydans]
MNMQTAFTQRARAFTLMWVTLGMASVAMAQAGNTGVGTGVSNMSAPRSPVSAPTAPAQAAVTQTPAPGNASLTPPASNRVGDATSYLLALQASGQYASRNAYPVTSDVAQRSYQRYLESFTHKIPESTETQVGSKTGGSR